MKNKLLFLFIMIIAVFMVSCGGHFFNPRYYYNKSSSLGGDGDSGGNSGEVPDIGGGEAEIPDGPWNNEDYVFDGSIIKDYAFGASFDGNNVPSYKFFKGSTPWSLEDSSKNEYYYNGINDGNKAQTYDINPANFYRYDGKNPLVSSNSAYNNFQIMKRFLFYRLQGKAVIVPLNNYLIAVDTYSKFVFAYGKITKTANAPVVGTPYPVEFKAVELYGEKRNFWEYDPIGIMVYENGELKLELYEEYKKEMAADANKFFPQIHNPDRPIASRNSPGVSPYFDKNKTPTDKPEIKVSMTELYFKNISSQTVKRYTLGNFSEFTGGIWNKGDAREAMNYGFFGYDVEMKISSEDIMVSEYKSVASKDSGTGIGAYLKRYQVDLGSEVSLELNTDKDQIAETESKDINIDLAFNLTKYDEGFGDFNDLYWPYKYSANNDLYLTVKFNKETKNAELIGAADSNRIISKEVKYNEQGEIEVTIILDGQDGDHVVIEDRKNTWGAWYGVGPCGEGVTGYNNQVQFRCKIKVEDIKK
ncbi:hypothetical protein [Brachyspira murdochii]|uniref:hypothetical protein n=1 Tax=Brachyspira murdochii TaxID=84378 RepID=UPI003005E617